MSEYDLKAAKRSADARMLARRAVDQIRDALCTLSYTADGMYEDEAQIALDALDWIESSLSER